MKRPLFKKVRPPKFATLLKVKLPNKIKGSKCIYLRVFSKYPKVKQFEMEAPEGSILVFLSEIDYDNDQDNYTDYKLLYQNHICYFSGDKSFLKKL